MLTAGKLATLSSYKRQKAYPWTHHSYTPLFYQDAHNHQKYKIHTKKSIIGK